MASDRRIGTQVALGEGLDLASSPIPACADEVDALLFLRVLRALRDVVFSTVDSDGMPASRVIDVMAVEPGRLFFLAPRGKSFHEEVMRTGVVTITGQTPDLRMVRLHEQAVRPIASSRSIACAAGYASRYAPRMPSERERNGYPDGSSSISSAYACF